MRATRLGWRRRFRPARSSNETASERSAFAAPGSSVWRTFFTAVRIRVRAWRFRAAHFRDRTIRFFALLIFGISTSGIPCIPSRAEKDIRAGGIDQLKRRGKPGLGCRFGQPPVWLTRRGGSRRVLGASEACGGESRSAGPSQRHAGHHRHSNAEASEFSHLLRTGIVARKQAGQSLTGRMIISATMLMNAIRRTTIPKKIAITANSN